MYRNFWISFFTISALNCVNIKRDHWKKRAWITHLCKTKKKKIIVNDT